MRPLCQREGLMGKRGKPLKRICWRRADRSGHRVGNSIRGMSGRVMQTQEPCIPLLHCRESS